MSAHVQVAPLGETTADDDLVHPPGMGGATGQDLGSVHADSEARVDRRDIREREVGATGGADEREGHACHRGHGPHTRQPGHVVVETRQSRPRRREEYVRSLALAQEAGVGGCGPAGAGRDRQDNTSGEADQQRDRTPRPPASDTTLREGTLGEAVSFSVETHRTTNNNDDGSVSEGGHAHEVHSITASMSNMARATSDSPPARRPPSTGSDPDHPRNGGDPLRPPPPWCPMSMMWQRAYW